MNAAVHPASGQLALLREQDAAGHLFFTKSDKAFETAQRRRASRTTGVAGLRAPRARRGTRPADRALAVAGAAPRRLRRTRPGLAYDAIDCGVDDLPAVLAERADWAGFSCTMPLKRAALAVADEVRPVAAAVGAANTLLPRPGGGWIADNTDVTGFVATVREAGVAPGDRDRARRRRHGAGRVAALADSASRRVRCSCAISPDGRAAHDGRAVGVDARPRGCSTRRRGALDADLVVSTLPPRRGRSARARDGGGRTRPCSTWSTTRGRPRWPCRRGAGAHRASAVR